jgi:hypothetical protein
VKTLLFSILLFASLSPALALKGTYTEIKWPKQKYVKKYRVEIYKSRLLTGPVLKRTVETNSLRWREPSQGKFYIRVAAIDGWGQQGPFSKLSEVEVFIRNNLFERPQLIAPSSNDEIVYESNEDRTRFSWEGKSYAQKYRLLVANDAQFRDPIINLETQKNQVDITPGTLNLDDKYFWKVQAYYDKKNFSESRSRQVQFNRELYPEDIIIEPEQTLEDEVKSDQKKDFFKRGKWNAGVAGTSLEFTQAPDNIDLTETLLTVKGGASFPIDDKWDAGFVGFANVFAISKEPESVEEAKIVGLNIRGGYQLLGEGSPIGLKIMPGYYMWTMITAGNFGIQSLSGGQLFILSTFKMAHPFWLYTKFAPLANGFSLDVGNREIAFGAGTPLWSPKWSLTIDYSSLSYTSEDTPVVEIELTSLSLGLQYNF